MRSVLGFLLALSSAAAAAGPGWQPDDSLRVDEKPRWFRVYVPVRLARPAPVVVLLHGGTQSMRKIFDPQAGGTNAWPVLADREGFLLVVPNGVNPSTGDPQGDTQSWNDLRPFGGAARDTKADDVGFMRALIDWTVEHYSVELDRIYVTGASNGGMMTFRLLLEMSDRLAAGAAFIAALPQSSPDLHPPVRPVPVMIVNGTVDPLVKWSGGEIPGRSGTLMGVEATLDWWIRANRADAAKVDREALPPRGRSRGCRVESSLYPPQPGGAPVLFYRVEGGGHSMPSITWPIPQGFLTRRILGPYCREAEGAELAWKFLKKNRKPARAVKSGESDRLQPTQ